MKDVKKNVSMHETDHSKLVHWDNPEVWMGSEVLITLLPGIRQCLVSFQPSDEDAVSLNVPMSNIMEEEQIKEDSCHRLSPVQGLRRKDGKKVLVLFCFQYVFSYLAALVLAGTLGISRLCCGM